MYKAMLVIKEKETNPYYGMGAIHEHVTEAGAMKEAEKLSKMTKIPIYVSAADMLENKVYPYITVARIHRND